MEFLSVAEARANLASVLDEISESKNHRVITRNGQPAAVLMSIDQYESMVETLEILSDPEEAAELLFIMNNKDKIEWTSSEEMKKIILERGIREGFLLPDGSKNPDFVEPGSPSD
ncbi:MAG: hypothetical protein RL174_238 [Actinomycetota bacterium]|jgi:prevent-host-death family protein